MLTVIGTYNWQYKHSPYLDASFYQDLDKNGESVYVDWASLYHYYNTTDRNAIEAMLNYGPDFSQARDTPWRLRVLEDEILGECGTGSYNCTNGFGKRKKRTVGSLMWQQVLPSYTKVINRRYISILHTFFKLQCVKTGCKCN